MEEQKKIGLFWPMHEAGLNNERVGGNAPRADAFIFEPHRNSDQLKVWIADQRVRDIVRIAHFNPDPEDDGQGSVSAVVLFPRSSGYKQSEYTYVRLDVLPEHIRDEIRLLMEKRLIEARAEREKPEVEAVLAALPQIDVREQLRKQRETLAEQARREADEAEAFWNVLPKDRVEGTNEIDFAWDLPKNNPLTEILSKVPIV